MTVAMYIIFVAVGVFAASVLGQSVSASEKEHPPTARKSQMPETPRGSPQEVDPKAEGAVQSGELKKTRSSRVLVVSPTGIYDTAH